MNNTPSTNPLELISELADTTGGKVEEVGILPDNSGFAVMSMPLPKDHWLYQTDEYGYSGEPPMTGRTGTDNPCRKILEDTLREAGRWAVRASTRCGKDEDFDPDAMVRNFIIGVLGYYTPDGLSHDHEEEK